MRGGHTFSLPVVVSFFHNLHRVGTTTAHFAVPKEKALRFDVSVNETADGRAERLLLIGA